LRSGGDVFGDFAEAIPDATGRLVFGAGSQGVFVPGEEISSVSVVRHSEIVDEEHAAASGTL
jgi:hypothetical protein